MVLSMNKSESNNAPSFPITREIVFGADAVPYSEERPVMLYTIIILNLIVYIITSFETGFIQSTVDWIARLGVIPAQLLVDPASIYRVFTAMFTHADIFHIFFNMYFLYIFGRAVERTLGKWRFLALYIASGIMAIVFHTVFTYIQDPMMLAIPSVGASGAISGVLGAYMLLFPGTRLSACFFLFLIPFCFELPAIYYLLSWFAIQVLEGYILFNSGIAFFAHAGGFLAGVASLMFTADKNRLRLLRLMSRARSLFGILYFYTPFERRGLSPSAKSLFALLSMALLAGTMVSYFLSTASPTTLALYKVAWDITGYTEKGIDIVFVYIHDGRAEPITYTAQDIVGRITSKVLEQYNLYLAPNLAGRTIEISKLKQTFIRVQYTLYRSIQVLVQPIYVKASYNEKGILLNANLVIGVSSAVGFIPTKIMINTAVSLSSYSAISGLISYMSAASLLVTLIAMYIVLYKDEDYVITPEI